MNPSGSPASRFQAGLRRCSGVFTIRLTDKNAPYCRSSAELVGFTRDNWERRRSGRLFCRSLPLPETTQLRPTSGAEALGSGLASARKRMVWRPLSRPQAFKLSKIVANPADAGFGHPGATGPPFLTEKYGPGSRITAKRRFGKRVMPQ